METNEIIVHHATENNLKNVSIRIPSIRSQYLPEYQVPGNLRWFWISCGAVAQGVKRYFSKLCYSSIFQNTEDRMWNGSRIFRQQL